MLMWGKAEAFCVDNHQVGKNVGLQYKRSELKVKVWDSPEQMMPWERI